MGAGFSLGAEAGPGRGAVPRLLGEVQGGTLGGPGPGPPDRWSAPLSQRSPSGGRGPGRRWWALGSGRGPVSPCEKVGGLGLPGCRSGSRGRWGCAAVCGGRAGQSHVHVQGSRRWDRDGPGRLAVSGSAATLLLLLLLASRTAAAKRRRLGGGGGRAELGRRAPCAVAPAKADGVAPRRRVLQSDDGHTHADTRDARDQPP